MTTDNSRADALTDAEMNVALEHFDTETLEGIKEFGRWCIAAAAPVEQPAAAPIDRPTAVAQLAIRNADTKRDPELRAWVNAPLVAAAAEREGLQDAFERSEFYFNGESPAERSHNWKVWVAAWKAARRPVRTFVKDIITGVAAQYRDQGMKKIAGEILSLIDAEHAAPVPAPPPADKRAAFDMTDAEWLDVFERVSASIPNVFGSYMKVRAAFARKAIRLADEARIGASPVNKMATLIAERDAAIMNTHRQALCIQQCAAHIGRETPATIDGLPLAVKHLVEDRNAARAAPSPADERAATFDEFRDRCEHYHGFKDETDDTQCTCPGNNHPGSWCEESDCPRRARAASANETGAEGANYRAGIGAVAKFIDKKAADYLDEYGYVEHDTGAVSWGSGNHADAKRDYHSSLVELAEEVRTLAAAPQPAQADTIQCQAHSGPDCTECGGTGVWHTQTDARVGLTAPRDLLQDLIDDVSDYATSREFKPREKAWRDDVLARARTILDDDRA